jgi:hypothetical protein
VYRAESSLDLFGKNIDVYRASDLMYFFLCEGIVVGETLLQCEALLVVVAVRLMLHMTACFGKVLFHLFIFFFLRSFVYAHSRSGDYLLVLRCCIDRSANVILLLLLYFLCKKKGKEERRREKPQFSL